MNRRISFVLWFFNRLLFQADEYIISAQQQAVNVGRHLQSVLLYLKRDWQGDTIPPSRTVEFSIEKITALKEKIDTFWSVYMDNKFR